MQSVSSRIWTRVAVSISYDDNNYTTGTFFISVFYYLFNGDSFNISLRYFADDNIWLAPKNLKEQNQK